MRARRLIALGTAGILGLALAPAVVSTAWADSATTTVGLTSSVNPSVKGQSVTLRATVADPAQATSTIAGSVTFSDGAAVIGTATVSAGKGSLATRLMTAGVHDLTATFTATGSTTPVTSPALQQTVTPATTTTTITSSRPTANYGDGGTITATVKAVAPGTGVPTGSVDFSVDGGFYWTAWLDATGKAKLALADLYPAFMPGSYTIAASYSGDADNTASSTVTGVVQTLVGITAPPVTTVTLNAAGKPTFSPTSFTMSSANPVGCNVTITNSSPVGIALTYGTPGNWKRLPFGSIAAGASGEFGVGLSNFTGYVSAMGASNYVALHCK